MQISCRHLNCKVDDFSPFLRKKFSLRLLDLMQKAHLTVNFSLFLLIQLWRGNKKLFHLYQRRKIAFHVLCSISMPRQLSTSNSIFLLKRNENERKSNMKIRGLYNYGGRLTDWGRNENHRRKVTRGKSSFRVPFNYVICFLFSRLSSKNENAKWILETKNFPFSFVAPNYKSATWKIATTEIRWKIEISFIFPVMITIYNVSSYPAKRESPDVPRGPSLIKMSRWWMFAQRKCFRAY